MGQKPFSSSPDSRCERATRPRRAPPMRDRSAGSAVRAASIVNSTAIAEATASPLRKLTPSANIPSSAMITVDPANSTARPAMLMAVSVAPSYRRRSSGGSG